MTEPLYLREPPAVHPAIIGCLERRGEVTQAEAIGSMLLLVANGALEQRMSTRRITTIARAHDVTVTELVPVADRWDRLDIIDQELVWFLFGMKGGAGALALVDLQAAARSRPRAFRQGLQNWQARVLERAGQLGLWSDGRPTDAGDATRRDTAAFRRYLHDFGTLDDEPPLAVELWGPYLAYAVVLDLGDRVARELGLDAPSVAADPNLATWKAWFGIE